MTNRNRFLWLYDQIEEQPMTGMEIAVLFVLLARDESGLKAINKADIGALVGVSERHVTTLLKDLEGKLIKKAKGEKVGRGRAPNRYVFRPDSVGAPIPDNWITNSKSGTGVHEQNDKIDADAVFRVENQSPNSGTGGPVICGEVLPPVKEHAGARVENNLLTKKNLELNPETLSVCVAREMPVGGGDLDLDWTLSATDRAFANERGFLNGSCDELFGQFLDHCATKGPRLSASWRSEWRKWVRREVKFDVERAQRNNQSTEAAHDQQRNSRSDNSANYGRTKRNHHTDLLLRDILDDTPSAVGRLDISASK